MKVAVFTSFSGRDPAYSLCNVVDDQIKMLFMEGYTPILLAGAGFPKEGLYEGVEIRTLPNVPTSNEGKLPDDYQKFVDLMEQTLTEYLKDVHVCITHDIIYQAGEIVRNLAARQLVL